jgi:hypothetical protein
LPIPDKQYTYPGKVPPDARDAKFPPIKLLRPPIARVRFVIVAVAAVCTVMRKTILGSRAAS